MQILAKVYVSDKFLYCGNIFKAILRPAESCTGTERGTERRFIAFSYSPFRKANNARTANSITSALAFFLYIRISAFSPPALFYIT